MLHLEVAEGVATVVLDRPPANAINRDWVTHFHALLDGLDARDDWRVLHIRSAHRIFSAGADIKEMREAFDGRGDVSNLVEAVREYQGLFARIESLPRMTLAEIGGAAMGGGFELALACDLRIIATEAKVGLPEVRIGLVAGAGGTQRLTRICGRATALRLLNGAEMVDGETALQLGLAQWCEPLQALPERARLLALRYAGQPAAASMVTKACINAAADPTSTDGFKLEYSGSKQLLESEDTQLRVRAFLAGNAEGRGTRA